MFCNFCRSCCGTQQVPDYKMKWAMYVCGRMIIGRTQKMLSCDRLQNFQQLHDFSLKPGSVHFTATYLSLNKGMVMFG